MQSPAPEQASQPPNLAPTRLSATLRSVVAAGIALVGWLSTGRPDYGTGIVRLTQPLKPTPRLSLPTHPIQTLKRSTLSKHCYWTYSREIRWTACSGKVGLSLQDLAGILQLDTARKNLRILRPGDTLLVRHEEGAVLGIERDVGIGQTFVVQRKGGTSDTELDNTAIKRFTPNW